VTVQNISAVTLAVKDMAKAVDFYQAKMGLVVRYGGPTASFTSFEVGQSYLNLILATEGGWSWWGRLILHVDDVDAIYNRLTSAGLSPDAPPEDASWGERYFHISDPDGHELSFAKRLGD
jgi:catechol 2,3-dioxygenase-like lactoylglutathione lyase family enzyme|tara:strand:+ start:8513 stop:8872 length:360 start_codon:yes stop_codon:yes gene_type:complete